MKKELNSRDPSFAGKVEGASVPVIEETLSVGIRKQEVGKVRAIKKVKEEDLIVSGPAYSQEVDVQRIPVNRYIDAAPTIRHEGDTMIIPVVREEVVVQTRLVLVEEVRITRHRREEIVEKPVTIRTEEVIVERSSDRSKSV